MKRFFRMYRVEQKIFLRSPDVILFCLAMPLVVFVVITMITGDKNAADSGLTYLQSSYVSLSTVGICCSAFMSIPITIVELRSQGILRRMYCSPCSPARLLACDTICSGVIAALSTLILTIAAAVIFGYRMAGNVFVYIALWLLTMISMFSIGLMVASLCRTTKSMNVATSLLYFPMLLFSGATIPAEVFPAWFQAVAKWMPLGVGIDLLKSVSLGCYDNIVVQVITLIAIAVICGTVAVRTFRWE
ncbi:MAG: ABC transporter permease [Lachnospiraceae bacterium]|nr:ABC transporter permease [Lachnospiraceae bacterium]